MNTYNEIDLRSQNFIHKLKDITKIDLSDAPVHPDSNILANIYKIASSSKRDAERIKKQLSLFLTYSSETKNPGVYTSVLEVIAKRYESSPEFFEKICVIAADGFDVSVTDDTFTFDKLLLFENYCLSGVSTHYFEDKNYTVGNLRNILRLEANGLDSKKYIKPGVLDLAVENEFITQLIDNKIDLSKWVFTPDQKFSVRQLEAIADIINAYPHISDELDEFCNASVNPSKLYILATAAHLGLDVSFFQKLDDETLNAIGLFQDDTMDEVFLFSLPYFQGKSRDEIASIAEAMMNTAPNYKETAMNTILDLIDKFGPRKATALLFASTETGAPIEAISHKSFLKLLVETELRNYDYELNLDEFSDKKAFLIGLSYYFNSNLSAVTEGNHLFKEINVEKIKNAKESDVVKVYLKEMSKNLISITPKNKELTLYEPKAIKSGTYSKDDYTYDLYPDHSFYYNNRFRIDVDDVFPNIVGGKAQQEQLVRILLNEYPYVFSFLSAPFLEFDSESFFNIYSKVFNNCDKDNCYEFVYYPMSSTIDFFNDFFTETDISFITKTFKLESYDEFFDLLNISLDDYVKSYSVGDITLYYDEDNILEFFQIDGEGFNSYYKNKAFDLFNRDVNLAVAAANYDIYSLETKNNKTGRIENRIQANSNTIFEMMKELGIEMKDKSFEIDER